MMWQEYHVFVLTRVGESPEEVKDWENTEKVRLYYNHVTLKSESPVPSQYLDTKATIAVIHHHWCMYLWKDRHHT